MLLCGGSGTRLWSLSREAYSEQFVRLHGIDGIGRALLVCNESLRFIAAEQFLQIGIDDAHIMHEPMRRNITPAIAATALQAQADGDDPLLLAWPSDHVIRDQGAFCAAVDIARAAAQTGDLVPFGITPRSAQTSYGYSRVDGAPSGSAQSVRAFIEKPALAQASEYLASGDYYWNSEMFQFRASRYLQELAALQPAMLAACRDAVAHAQREETIRRREVFRPWGSYDLIGAGRRFHGKRISVKPGATLSLQMHHHRVHWVVASGTAKVTNGDQEYLLSESQSTYIALNVVHSLENPGKIALELIEIQCGAYLGEDDIVRLPGSGRDASQGDGGDSKRPGEMYFHYLVLATAVIAASVIFARESNMKNMAMTDTGGGRVDWVDYAKGICIIAVVTFYSSGYVEQTMQASGWMHYLVDFAQPFRMPDFFMLSGLFMARVLGRPLRSYLNTRVMHFFYFYALWATIKFVLVDLHGQLDLGAYQILLNYLYLYIQPESQLWFIYILPLFFIVVRLSKSVPVALVYAAAIAFKLYSPDTGWKMIDRFALYFVFFYTGHVFATHLFRLAAWVHEHVYTTLTLLAAWTIANMLLVTLKVNWIPLGHLIMGHAGALAIFLLAALLARLPWMRWLAYLGEHSIVAYLGFVVPLFVLRKLLTTYRPEIDIGTLSLATGVLSILGSFLLYWSVRHTPFRFLFERPAWTSIMPRPPLALKQETREN